MRKPVNSIARIAAAATVAALVALPLTFSPGGKSGLPLFFAFH